MSHAVGDQLAQFALIVVNYGSSRLISENLAHTRLAECGGRVVVVDNFTSESERKAVVELAAERGWETLLLETNVGFGAGVNAGAARAIEAGADALVVLNPDARIDDSDIVQLVGAVRTDPDLLVAPIIRSGDGAIWFDGIDLCLDSGRMASRRRQVMPPGPREPWISGACLAISRRMWERVGGFDEEYFLYWEDVDLSWRVVANGGRLAIRSDLSAVHDAGGTQEPSGDARTKSEIYYFYNIRNRLLYAAKHLDDRQRRRWLWSTPRVSYEILLAGGHRQFFRSIAPIRAYVRGIWAGCRMLAEHRRLTFR